MWRIILITLAAAGVSTISCKPAEIESAIQNCDGLFACIVGGDTPAVCNLGGQPETNPLACCVDIEKSCTECAEYGGCGFGTSCLDNAPAACEAIDAQYGGTGTGNDDDDGDDGLDSPEGGENGDGADSTGDMCGDVYGSFQCRGWVAGLHKYAPGAGTGPNAREFDLGPAGTHYRCIDDIMVEAPIDEDPDGPVVNAACREACDAAWSGYTQWNLNGSQSWEFDRNECIFEPSGNGGVVPSDQDDPGTDVGTAACDWFDDESQNIFLGAADDTQCSQADCSSTAWNPNHDFSYSFNAITRVHTVAGPRSFFEDLLVDPEQLFACDVTRYAQSFNVAGAESWAITDATSGDLLYRLGFRTGDYDVTIKRNATGTHPTYPLSSYTAMGTAFAALNGYNAFKLTFKRPLVTGGYATHTINLTLS